MSNSRAPQPNGVKTGGIIRSIPAPQGMFDAYYNRALTPEDIKQEIDFLGETDAEAAALRERLFSYRFYTRKEAGKLVTSDRFMSFWVTLQFYDKSTGKSKFRLRVARRSLQRELFSQKLRDILGGDPDERFIYEQLYNAARRLLQTCKTDRSYTTTMFGFGAIKGEQLEEKTIADFFDALYFSHRCGLLAEYPVIGKAAFHAFADEFPYTEDAVISRVKKVAGEPATTEIFTLVTEQSG